MDVRFISYNKNLDNNNNNSTSHSNKLKSQRPPSPSVGQRGCLDGLVRRLAGIVHRHCTQGLLGQREVALVGLLQEAHKVTAVANEVLVRVGIPVQVVAWVPGEKSSTTKT